MVQAMYKDLDVSFVKHPGNRDILKKYDVSAVKQALRNLLLSNQYDKPFDPAYGLGLYGYLFENFSPAMRIVLKRKIVEQVEQYEPRVVIEDVQLLDQLDSNELVLKVLFYVKGDPEPHDLNVAMERTR